MAKLRGDSARAPVTAARRGEAVPAVQRGKRRLLRRDSIGMIPTDSYIKRVSAFRDELEYKHRVLSLAAVRVIRSCSLAHDS